MRKRIVVTLLVASLVLLAGCSGGTSSPTPTETPGTTGDTPTATDGSTDTPAGQTGTYPAGYEEAGVANATTAASTHREALTATDGFAVDYDATVTTPNATTTVTYDQRVETGSREVVRRTNVTSGDVSGQVVRYYVDDTVYFRSQQPGAETTYGNQSQRYAVSGFTGIEFVSPALTDVSFGSSEVTTRDGTEVVVYSDATLDATDGLFGEDVDRANVSDFAATLVVGTDGIVRELSYAATVERRDGDRTVEVTVAVSGIGSTTVDEPSWLSQA